MHRVAVRQKHGEVQQVMERYPAEESTECWRWTNVVERLWVATRWERTGGKRRVEIDLIEGKITVVEATVGSELTSVESVFAGFDSFSAAVTEDTG